MAIDSSGSYTTARVLMEGTSSASYLYQLTDRDTFPGIIAFPFETQEIRRNLHSDPKEGVVQVRERDPRAFRRWTLTLGPMPESEAEEIHSAIADLADGAKLCRFDCPEPVLRPYSAPTVLATTGGVRSYSCVVYVAYSWGRVDGGESRICVSATSASLEAYERVKVQVPAFPSGVDFAYIYCGGTAETLRRQREVVLKPGVWWYEPAGGYEDTGILPRTTEGLYEQPLARIVPETLDIERTGPQLWMVSVKLEEVPEPVLWRFPSLGAYSTNETIFSGSSTVS